MRFPPQFLDELRARLPVSEVVGRRVKLKKAGREWKGLSPFNKEKTPVVLRQRPEDGVVRLFLRQERLDLRFRDADRRPYLPGSGRAAGRAGRHAAAESVERGRGARAAPPHPARRGRTRRQILRGDARRPSRRQGARLSRRPRPRSGDAARNSASAMRRTSALRSRSTSARKGVSVEDMVAAGLLVVRRRHSGALRPLPRSCDLPDLPTCVGA